MPTGETENASLGTATKQVAEHASSLARLELELAILELKRKVTALGIGIGLGVGAAVFALFMLGFGFATVAAGLATTMFWAATTRRPNWPRTAASVSRGFEPRRPRSGTA